MKYTTDIINDQIRNRGLTMLSEYAGMLVKADFRCASGHEWSALVANIVRGSGCPACAGCKRHTQESINALLEEKGLSLAGEFVSTNSVTPVRCLRGHQWNAKISNLIHKTTSGCPHCSGLAALTPEVVVKRLRGRSITLIGEVKRTKDSTRFSCDCCGYQWDAALGQVLRKSGCPKCSLLKRGFQIDKPGTLYVLVAEDGAQVKVGISNNYKKRIRSLSKATPFKFRVFGLHHGTGEQVSAMERYAHQHLKRFNCEFKDFNGSTEWFKAIAPVWTFLSLL